MAVKTTKWPASASLLSASCDSLTHTPNRKDVVNQCLQFEFNLDRRAKTEKISKLYALTVKRRLPSAYPPLPAPSPSSSAPPPTPPFAPPLLP